MRNTVFERQKQKERLHFLLFLNCFLTNDHTIPSFNDSEKEVLEGQAKMTSSVFYRVKNIVEKEKMLVTSNFSLFFTMFSKGFFLKVIKGQDCAVQNSLV